MRPFDTLCAMWYHLYELKNVQNTHRVLEIVIFDKQFLKNFKIVPIHITFRPILFENFVLNSSV